MSLAHDVSRRIRGGLGIGAACLLTAACALGERVSPLAPSDLPVVVYSAGSRVPGSTLVSRRDLQFRLFEGQWRGSPVTLLLHRPAVGDSFPVAVIQVSQKHVSFYRLPLPKVTADAADLQVATLENLYVLALRQNAEGKYCLTAVSQSCDAAKDGHSHAELLRALARERESALTRASRDKPGIPWRVISMIAAPPAGGDADQVGVRLMRDERPMEGATVFFNRAPHSGCFAKTNADGIATCELVDQHGDGDSHAEHDRTPVVVTYPGDVRADLVLVPMTLVMQAGATEPLARIAK
jgi:hypothetical protein